MLRAASAGLSPRPAEMSTMTAYIFLSLLGGGILGALACSRLDLMAWKFVRIASILASAVLIFVTVVYVLRPPPSLLEGSSAVLNVLRGGFIAASLCAIILLCMAPLVERTSRALRGVAALGSVVAVASISTSQWVEGSWSRGSVAVGISLIAANVLAAGLLGTVTLAWLLGHAYLTATTMTVAPLRQLSRFFAWAAAARLLFFGASVAGAYLLAGDRVAVHFAGAWLVLFVRCVAGLIAVAVFSYMVGECVKLRNTQAATGLLYFASLLAYMGELSAQYLMSEWHWPM